jgi:hypothetical protein
MGRIAYDPKCPDIDERIFHHNAEWKEFYGDVTEELPPNMPEPRGRSVTISAFVDANHAGNIITRRSHSGIFLFVQNAPIIWFSKRQNTVEAATFGSEFVALRICKELIVALRYKLRMFGVPIDRPANVFCDNRGVVKNASIPESTLLPLSMRGSRSRYPTRWQRRWRDERRFASNKIDHWPEALGLLLEPHVVDRTAMPRSRDLPSRLCIDGLQSGFVFTSHGEDVHLRVGLLGC